MTDSATLLAATFIGARRPRPQGGKWQAEADDTVQRMMKEHGIPGVMLAVVKDGLVAYQKGYGVKRVPNGGVPDANTVFYIGSL